MDPFGRRQALREQVADLQCCGTIHCQTHRAHMSLISRCAGFPLSDPFPCCVSAHRCTVFRPDCMVRPSLNLNQSQLSHIIRHTDGGTKLRTSCNTFRQGDRCDLPGRVRYLYPDRQTGRRMADRRDGGRQAAHGGRIYAPAKAARIAGQNDNAARRILERTAFALFAVSPPQRADGPVVAASGGVRRAQSVHPASRYLFAYAVKT